jgi:hypothetical protein
VIILDVCEQARLLYQSYLNNKVVQQEISAMKKKGIPIEYFYIGVDSLKKRLKECEKE